MIENKKVDKIIHVVGILALQIMDLLRDASIHYLITHSYK